MSKHLTRFDPLADLAGFDPMRSIDDFFRGTRMKQALRELEAAPAEIRLDLTETEKAYTVKAEMPGANKDDIEVNIDGNRVSIAVETRHETEKKEAGNVVHSERYIGKSFRSFTLEHDVDDAAAQANYRDGVLELTLPKRPDGKGSKKLTIH
ncbi:MAG: Hsp20/alpha crystallin family protein [Telluria sp.]